MASLDELATQLLAARGSTLDDERERERSAHAVLRAGVELEASVTPEKIRFEAYAKTGSVLIATTPAHAEYARRPGRTADALVSEDPLPSPGRVVDELGLVPVPEGVGSRRAWPPPRQSARRCRHG